MKLLTLSTIIVLCCLYISTSAGQKSPTISEAEYINGVYIPANLQEAWNELKKSLSNENRQRLTEISEEELISFHFSGGLSLRNSWGLWKGSRLAKYFNEMGIHHPDDMSFIII